MKNILVVWKIFGRKLQSSFSMTAINSLFSSMDAHRPAIRGWATGQFPSPENISWLWPCLCHRQTLTSSGNVKKEQLKFGLPRRHPFFTVRDSRSRSSS